MSDIFNEDQPLYTKLSKWPDQSLLIRIALCTRALLSGGSVDVKLTRAVRDTAMQILMQRLTTMRQALRAYDDAMTVCWGSLEGIPPEHSEALRIWSMVQTTLKETGHAPSP